MKIAEKRLIETIPASPGTSFDFKGTYTDINGTTHNVTVFDTSYFTTNVFQLYRNRRITIDEDAQDYLATLFSVWKSSRENLYLKQAYAYTLRYNPIENYSSHEQMTNDITTHLHGESITRTHNDTISTTPAGDTVTTTHPAHKTEVTYPQKTTETTPYNTTEVTAPDNDTNTHYVKGFNSADFVGSEKDVKTGSVSVNTTHTDGQGNQSVETIDETYTGKETTDETYTGTDQVQTTHTQGTEAHTGTITDAHTGTDTDTRNYTLDKTGNIGVQTAAEMLQREYDGLMQDLAHRALLEFVDRYTFYSEEVD